MKAIKFILLFVVCMAMAACGNAQNNIESYKEQYLEAWAKDLGTTKEYLLKDLDISIDSIKIIPLTVTDSLNILNEVNKDDGAKLREFKTVIRQLKSMEGLLALSGDTEKVKEAKKMINEMPSEIAALEKALKEDLSRYKEMDGDKVLSYIVSLQAAVLDPKTGIHKIEQRKAVFNTNGKLDKFSCPNFLELYLNDKLK